MNKLLFLSMCLDMMVVNVFRQTFRFPFQEMIGVPKTKLFPLIFPHQDGQYQSSISKKKSVVINVLFGSLHNHGCNEHKLKYFDKL